MHWLICYDIAHDRRRRRVARLLEGYGDRLHESAFALHLRPAQLARLCRALPRCIHEREDIITLYPLCRRDHPDILHLGLSAWPRQEHCVVL